MAVQRDRDPVNILVVDDQPAKLLSYEVILEELGENLIKATSGRQALEQLLRNEVAVILVDVAMPELDGFELAAMIRDHPRFAQIALIFVSAVHMSEIDSLRGYQAGAVDYLPVPIVPALLRAKVRVFCDLFRKTRQLEILNAELERRVEARTAELAAANADLERRVEARTREREEALAQVAQMQKLESLGQLTGGLAHDFNNLLMVVLSNLELARSRITGDDLTRWLGRATEAANSGASLTKRMLAFARRQDLKPESVPLSDVVNGMVEMMSHSLDPEVRIVADLPSDLPNIRIDRNQLELSLLNLGLNARDAMPTGGQIVIKAKIADEKQLPEELTPGAYVNLSIADTGVGMDADTLRRAAEPFFSTKRGGKGLGLGLSMVHGLALQSGGAMQIVSRLGEGTTVLLWLPVASDVRATGPDATVSAVAVENRPRRVLLVDDDPLVLMATADMLRELGHEPIEMTSAKKALEAVRGGERPDLAILDYAMPEMSGVALAELLREAYPELPLVLATGYSEREKSGGALPRLDKPYTLAELNRQIGSLAARAR
jgi:signal transduction histidine kinase